MRPLTCWIATELGEDDGEAALNSISDNPLLPSYSRVQGEDVVHSKTEYIFPLPWSDSNECQWNNNQGAKWMQATPYQLLV